MNKEEESQWVDPPNKYFEGLNIEELSDYQSVLCIIKGTGCQANGWQHLRNPRRSAEKAKLGSYLLPCVKCETSHTHWRLTSRRIGTGLCLGITLEQNLMGIGTLHRNGLWLQIPGGELSQFIRWHILSADVRWAILIYASMEDIGVQTGIHYEHCFSVPETDLLVWLSTTWSRSDC